MLEAVKEAVQRIAHYNSHINAIVSVRSIERIVDHAERAIAARKPLAGLTVSIKDNFMTKDDPTTCASSMLSRFVSPYDAEAVKLLQNAGATIVGKTNMDEFGMGSNNVYSCHGLVRNPLDASRVAGGSSGGSAAAVASGMCDIALGSDTGGSVRLPASYCGVVGMKPSYGLVSRWGLVSYATSLDTVGVLAKNVSLAKLAFDSLNHFDDKDPTSLPPEYRSQPREHPPLEGVKGLRIGVPDEYNISELDDKVISVWSQALSIFAEKGAEIVPVSLPSTRHALSAYYVLAPAEAASNLARYDGVQFGSREASRSSASFSTTTRGTHFGPEVIRRIILGNFTLSSGFFDAYYIKAQKIRRAMKNDFDMVFRKDNILGRSKSKIEKPVDAIITPTSMSIAPKIEEVEARTQTVGTLLTTDIMTVPASLAGIPAISIPMDRTPADDSPMPIGIQIITQFGDEEMLFHLAQVLEKSET